jgi:hypothetical protein
VRNARPLRPLLAVLPLAGGAAAAALLLASCGLSSPAHRADLRWANTACTSLLAFKNELHRDGTSMNLSFGPQERLQTAIADARALERRLQELGLPPMERHRLTLPAAGPAADLALSALETQSCRTLAGLPV